VLHRDDSKLEKVFETPLDHMKDGLLQFSVDGKLLAIFDPGNSVITIYKLDLINEDPILKFQNDI